MPNPILGIDLGTTYSCVAVVDKFKQPQVLRSREGASTTPSIISFDSNDQAIVGEEAKNRWRACPEKTVAFIKREMINEDSFHKPTPFPYGYDPSEFSAFILRKLLGDAIEALADDYDENEPVKAVITCPAYFDTRAKERTKQAGIMAGLDVLHIINEPTAAAIAYGAKSSEDQTILVYDLGGGTFDVTILKVENRQYKVIATGGNPLLGGYDWDQCLAKWILNAYNKQYNTSYQLPATEEALQNADPKIKRMRASLLIEAERLKKSLCNNARRGKKNATSPDGPAQGTAETSWLFEDDGHSLQLTKISLSEFEEMTETLLQQTIDKVRETLKTAADKGVTKIDKWILVGGSSYMPQVKERLDSVFGCDALLSDPNEAVAKGAALYSDGQVRDVTSKTYGTDCLVTENGETVKKVKNLIFMNDEIPVVKDDTFTTSTQFQKEVPMEIYESDSMERLIDPTEAELINGNNTLHIQNQLPKGSPINVKFSIDKSGILHVYAHMEDGSSLEFDMEINGVKTKEELKNIKGLIDNKSQNL